MTTAEIKDLLDQLAAAGVFFLVFSGGEVFLRRDFFELLEHARSLLFSGLERHYADHAPSYFRQIVRRLHRLSSEELAVIVDDAVDTGQITAREGDDLIAADIVIRGRRTADQSDAYLVVEVSWGVGKDDVERAARRAAILAKLGIPALAAVAGEFVTADAAELARTQGVWQVMDGRVIAPESPSS